MRGQRAHTWARRRSTARCLALTGARSCACLTRAIMLASISNGMPVDWCTAASTAALPGSTCAGVEQPKRLLALFGARPP